jgi:anaphase-promoting complex subunit 1
MVILGQIDEAGGLSDMQITNKLLKIVSNNDFGGPLHGSIVALGLMFMKTKQLRVAEKLAIPNNLHAIDRIPPDIIILRIISKNLILWDMIEPSVEWIEGLMPEFIRDCKLDDESQDITIKQTYGSIVVGACLSIALRFAGSANMRAFEVLTFYFDKIVNLPMNGIFSSMR